jgi:hypothetical protein
MSPQTLGYLQNLTGDQALSAGTEAAITGIYSTVVVPEGRRLRITVTGNLYTSSADDVVDIRIKQDGIQIGLTEICRLTGAGAQAYIATVIISPTAGAHTYTATAQRVSGTGTVNHRANTSAMSYILVEDITGSTLPYQPASVPVGVLAQAVRTADFAATGATSVGTAISVPDYLLNVAVPAGRLLRINLSCFFYSSVAADRVVALIYQDGVLIKEVLDPDLEINLGDTKLASVLVSPSAGSHTYEVKIYRQAGSGTPQLGARATNPSHFWIEDVTPTPAPSSGAPGSTLGYTENKSLTQAVTTTADLTGLTATVTVPDGRRLRISAHVYAQQSGGNQRSQLAIQEGGTQLQAGYLNHSEAAINESIEASVIVTPSAGVHTYKLTGNADAGTSTFGGSATNPAYILVEDITGSVWPEGSEITAGMVASEAWNVFSPVVTQGVVVAHTVSRATYIKIGRTVHASVELSITGAGTAGSNIVVSLPVPAASSGAIVGSGIVYDSSTTTVYAGIANTIDSTTLSLWPASADGTTSFLGNRQFSAGLASGDLVRYGITYEAAA